MSDTTHDWMVTPEPVALLSGQYFRIGGLNILYPDPPEVLPRVWVTVVAGAGNENDGVRWVQRSEHMVPADLVQQVMATATGGANIYEEMRNAVYTACQQAGFIPANATMGGSE